MADAAHISSGRVKLRAGTLYSAVDRLRGDGLVDVEREEVVDGRLRRYYRLPPTGSRRLAEEAEHLSTNASVATSRLTKLATGLAGGTA